MRTQKDVNRYPWLYLKTAISVTLTRTITTIRIVVIFVYMVVCMVFAILIPLYALDHALVLSWREPFINVLGVQMKELPLMLLSWVTAFIVVVIGQFIRQLMYPIFELEE